MAAIAGAGEGVLAGLIQVTAALHHLRRNNPQGTMLLLQVALRLSARLRRHFRQVALP
ncbi:MAG: DUF309 domain-containing protein [Candidatus Sulfotelmatobacter sp.]